jgi:hypothetical protein
MNDELEFNSLEAQLRREAREISKPYGGKVSAAAIRAEHRRRRRRATGWFSAAAALMGLIAGAAWWSMTRPTSQDVRPAVAESLEPRPVQPQPDQANVARKSMAAQEPQDSDDIPNEAVTFLVTAEDGRRVIAVGRYVPPRTERVNLRDLPPLEQAAVRRLLGLADEEVKPTI